MFKYFMADNGYQVAINPQYVVSVNIVPPGVKIELTTGKFQMVTDSYETVIQSLTGV